VSAVTACRILDQLGLDSQRPPVARAQAPPERFDPGPDYDVADHSGLPAYAKTGIFTQA